jgi:hypothetical protein
MNQTSFSATLHKAAEALPGTKPNSGSAVTNGREPKCCLGRVFNFKLGRIAALLSKNAAATSRVENSAQG